MRRIRYVDIHILRNGKGFKGKTTHVKENINSYK
jgi:hypothetical protein